MSKNAVKIDASAQNGYLWGLELSTPYFYRADFTKKTCKICHFRFVHPPLSWMMGIYSEKNTVINMTLLFLPVTAKDQEIKFLIGRYALIMDYGIV